jgi:carboxymethylenebutenolidase
MSTILSSFLATLFVLLFAGISAAAVPPDASGAKEALEKSPRHGEWVDVKAEQYDKPLKCYIVYPETKEKAPVVIVIHEIFGLSDWVRSVADELAADGFIAIAPDMLSGMGKDGGGTDSFGGVDEVRKAISGLDAKKVDSALDGVLVYGKALPASNGKTATIGFCWGGGKSFHYATVQKDLAAAVVYYGTSPKDDELATISAPVLGCYGADDARVNATIEPARTKLKELGKTYEPNKFDDAGHGFLRQQQQRPANADAAKKAWPMTIDFLKKHTMADSGK